MTLNLPLDFERLPEFWQLKETLRTTALELAAKDEVAAGVPAGTFDPVEELVEDTSALLWIRLWIVLGYLARSTNRAGWLNTAGERQLNQTFRRVWRGLFAGGHPDGRDGAAQSGGRVYVRLVCDGEPATGGQLSDEGTAGQSAEPGRGAARM